MTRKQGYMQAGDALRALAATLVLVYHVLLGSALAAGGPGARHVATDTLLRNAYGSPLGTIAAHLNAGLYVFFALTGYFVGGPYVRAWIGVARRPAVRHYLSRRVRRIVPAFWVFAAISILVLHPHHNSFADVASVFGFAQNYHGSVTSSAIVQAWTLDIEAAFYLALPLLALALGGRAVRPAVMVAAVAALGAISLAIAPRYPALADAFSMSLPAVLWAFVPGLALAAVEPLLALRLRSRALPLALLGASAAGFVLVTRVPTSRNVAHCLALALFAGGLVAAALTWQWSAGAMPRWAVNRVSAALGRWSYGIYLAHFVLSIKLIELAPASTGAKETALIALPLTLAASIAAAALSWRLLERPILEWRSEPRVSPAPAAERGVAFGRLRGAFAGWFGDER
jgi:peptidoglycan/LPS O-acetylase OafA/YrhL